MQLEVFPIFTKIFNLLLAKIIINNTYVYNR